MVNLLAKTKNTVINRVFNNDLTLKYAANGGGYESYQYFIASDGGILSLETVQAELKIEPVLFDDEDDPQWFIVACRVNYESNDLYCDHTSKVILPAYED